MSFKEKIQQHYLNSYLKKYGDRLTQVQGKVVSIKSEEKSILWLFHKLSVTILIKPDRSRNIVKCFYNKKKWFKKPQFISISQGNLLFIQGLKGKRGKKNKQGIDLRESIQIMNVRNLTTKKDLIPVEGNQVQKIKQKVKYR